MIQGVYKNPLVFGFNLQNLRSLGGCPLKFFNIRKSSSEYFVNILKTPDIQKVLLLIYPLLVSCQALSISQSLNLSLSLRDRDRADTTITLYHTTTPPPHHHKLFKYLRVDLYSSVIHHWNRQLKPYSFPLRKNRVN